MNIFKIMPDVDTTGIFDKDLDPLSFHELELPKELEDEFREWIRFYNEDCHKTRHFIFKDEMADQLNERGKNLALKLKELYPDAKVSYIGEDEIGFILEQMIYLPE